MKGNKGLEEKQVENKLQLYESCEGQSKGRRELEMRELVEMGVVMAKALDEGTWSRWMEKLYNRLGKYIEMKRESSFTRAEEMTQRSHEMKMKFTERETRGNRRAELRKKEVEEGVKVINTFRTDRGGDEKEQETWEESRKIRRKAQKVG